MIRLRYFATCLLCASVFHAQDPRLAQVTALAPASGGAPVGFVLGAGASQSVLIRIPSASLETSDPAPLEVTLFDRDHSILAHGTDGTIRLALAAGAYTAEVAASSALLSFPPAIEIHAQNPTGARLLNTSARVRIDASAGPALSFVVSDGFGSCRVLIRAAGPALHAFSVANPVPDPALHLTADATGAEIAANDNWATPSSPPAASAATLKGAFAQTGAFDFPGAGKDAALLVDLAPGRYTVHVRDVTGASGVALVELYEVSRDSVSATLPRTAALAAPTSTPVTIAAVAALPAAHHSADLDADFSISLLELTRVIELYNTRNGTTRTGGYRVLDGGEDGFASDSSVAPEGPAAVLTRYHSADTSRDGRIDLRELTRVIELYNFRRGTVRTGDYHSRAGTEDGFTGGALTIVTIAATKNASDESGANAGEFTITRTGETSTSLVVSYGVGGTAGNGTDFATLAGSVTIPAGATTVKLPLSPLPDLVADGSETAIVTLVTSTADYELGAQSTATVTIADSPSTLYVATLRPENTALDSIASGSATLSLSASGTLASINVSFSNLSSAEVSAHLRISPSGDFVGGVPRGQVSGSLWRLPAVGIYTSADLLAALKSGRIYIGIDTVNYPSGELKGTLIQGAGSQTFSPPVDPPAVSLTATTRTDAARFLMQATFGPKKSEVDALTGQSIDAWLNNQLALPFTSHRTATVSDRTNFGGSSSFTNFNAIYPPNRQFAWFKLALTAPDQLRQRVAFALSQIFVVSDVSLGNDNQTEPLANYYDILGNGAFGNFRTLLENVTLSPMMGIYLSSLRNAKADPVAGTTPDENFAREVMQLFTIGLSQLQPDGTLKLDGTALPIATYDQTTITEMAKVFTGWAYPSTNANAFRTAGTNYYSPMQLFTAFHEPASKTIINGIVLPANLGGTEDLRRTLDALFNHPNTAPFICQQLIQRLVTSNPSPAYIYRVAQKFVNNGAGVRGDLGAVVKAIYTDYEARSPAVASNIAFGKLKEPLLRLTGLLRTFNATAPNGRYAGLQVNVNGTPINGTTLVPAASTSITTLSAVTLSSVQTRLAEAPLRSPSVFNFFSPSYVEPGSLAAAGLVAPEFQITDATTSIDAPNFFRSFLVNPNTAAVSVAVTPDLSYEQTLLATPTVLLDHLATVLAGGNLPQATRDVIIAKLAALPASATSLDRARAAVLLVLTSPAGATQR